MGLFDFLKSKHSTSSVAQTTISESLVNGELPFGWTYRNKEFVEKYNNEYTFFLNQWIESLKLSPKEKYSALKSFVIFLDDLKKLCYQKGDCFALWFDDIIASPEYIETRKSELIELESNLDRLTSEYELHLKESKNLENRVLEVLAENPEILQTDVYKNFHTIVKEDVSSILYRLAKENKITRIKSGKTYLIKLNV